MTPEESAEIQRLCEAALEAVRGVLWPEAYRQAHDWIHRYGERGLAMEHVIDWLGEDCRTVDDAQFNAIQAAMASMGEADSDAMRYLATRRARSPA